MIPRISLFTLSRVLWALVLVTLPITSFRYVPFMGSGTYVRPLALYPLVLLLPVLAVRLWRKEIPRPWPGTLTILSAFTLAALATTAFGSTLAPVELRGVEYFDRALRALITLGMGLAFFAAAIWMNQSEDDVRFSVKWLLVGLVAHLVWGAIQFVGLNTGRRQILTQIQQIFSVRGLVKNKRISGFAFEPSWLAGQIVTLYLPWLVADLLTGMGVFQKFFFHLSSFLGWRGKTRDERNSWIEPILLLGALTALLMTYSRSGLAVAIIAGGTTFLAAGGPIVRSAFGWFQAGFRLEGAKTRLAAVQVAGSRVILILLMVSVLAGAGFFLADKGYIATFFTSEKENLFDYAVSVYLGPRLAYATSALEAFQQHPFTGVGLGASGFWIYPNMPDWVLAGVPEIAQQMSPDAGDFPNPKNIFVRLLAETGLAGFVLFVAFYLAVFADVLELLRKSRWLGAAGMFAFVAVVMQGVSQDSFALPELWLNLGILAGITGIFSQRSHEDPK
jgi:O-antigen ligase